MIRKLMAVAVGASTALLSTSALAQYSATPPPPSRSAGMASEAGDPLNPEGWSIAGLLGFGFSAYAGFGIGVRGGYTLPNHVYLGGTFIDYVGLATYYGNSFLTGFEGGYDLKAGPLIVRPYGGVGVVDVSYSYYNPNCVSNGVTVVCANGYSNGGSSAFFAFWAGGTVLYPIKDGPWFVGGDLRFLISGYGTAAFTGTIMGTGGYQF